jgi:drug/metabolite transporter (DMT)-like permease
MVIAALALGAVLLGVNWIAIRLSNMELPPLWGAGARFAVASLLLLAIARVSSVTLPRGQALAGALIYGVLGYGLNFALVYWALVHLSAGIVAVTFAALPLLQLVVSSRLGHEHFTRMGVLGATMVLAGVVTVFGDRLQAGAAPAAIAAALIAALAAAGAAAAVKAFPQTHPIATNTLGTGVGAVFLLSASVLAGEQWMLPAAPETRLAVAYLAVSTGLLVVLLTYMILRWTATATAYVTVLSPLVALPLATLVLSETFSTSFYIGAGAICVGTYLGVARTVGHAA